MSLKKDTCNLLADHKRLVIIAYCNSEIFATRIINSIKHEHSCKFFNIVSIALAGWFDSSLPCREQGRLISPRRCLVRVVTSMLSNKQNLLHVNGLCIYVTDIPKALKRDRIYNIDMLF